MYILTKVFSPVLYAHTPIDWDLSNFVMNNYGGRKPALRGCCGKKKGINLLNLVDYIYLDRSEVLLCGYYLYGLGLEFVVRNAFFEVISEPISFLRQ